MEVQSSSSLTTLAMDRTSLGAEFSTSPSELSRKIACLPYIPFQIENLCFNPFLNNIFLMHATTPTAIVKREILLKDVRDETVLEIWLLRD